MTSSQFIRLEILNVDPDDGCFAHVRISTHIASWSTAEKCSANNKVSRGSGLRSFVEFVLRCHLSRLREPGAAVPADALCSPELMDHVVGGLKSGHSLHIMKMKQLIDQQQATVVPSVSIIILDEHSEKVVDGSRVSELIHSLKTGSLKDRSRYESTRYDLCFNRSGREMRPKLSSEALDEHTWEKREAFFSACPHVATTPGVVHILGEKVGLKPVTQTLMHTSRRLWVGHQLSDGKLSPSKTVTHVLKDSDGGKIKEDRVSTIDYVDPLAYTVFSDALEIAFGIRPTGLLHAWCHWEGERGLSFSGALSVASTCAVLSTYGIHVDSSGDPSQWDEATRKMMAVAWCFEAGIHLGRTHAGAVATSMTWSGLPILYRATNSEDRLPPKLFRLELEPDPENSPDRDEFEWDQMIRHRQIENLIEFVSADNHPWSIRRLYAGNTVSAESACWDTLHEIIGLMVIDTGTHGSTGQAHIRELRNEITGMIKEPVHQAMGALCEEVASSLVRITDANVDLDVRKQIAAKLVDCVGRYRGMLIALGFGFPEADVLCGKLTKSIAKHQSSLFSIKTSGKGTAGNLVSIYETDTSLQSALHKSAESKASGSTGVLYDSWLDGPEVPGMMLCKSDGTWINA